MKKMTMKKMTHETKKPTTSGGLWYASFKANRELLKEKVEAKLGYDLTLGEYREWCDTNGYSWRTGMRAVWSVAKRVSLSNRMANWWKNRSTTGQGATPIAVAKKEIAPVKPIAVAKAKDEKDINAMVESLLANMDF